MTIIGFSEHPVTKCEQGANLSLHDEHNRAMASTVPRNITDESAMMAISVAPIWLIFSCTVTP